ncbi:hypothetical protein PIB30_045151, partial [Stylosanthes scabra]|nr:hypothetical protein [Stylosanthes scabra]
PKPPAASTSPSAVASHHTCARCSGSNYKNLKGFLSVRASASSSSSGDKERSIIRKEKDGVWKKINYADEKPPKPLLDTINPQIRTKNLSKQTGGHLTDLSSSLGFVELSVALHHVFSTPEDKIIWDVGYQEGLRKKHPKLQAYPHKILTGRRSRMHTIRMTSGLAGFPKRDESVPDAFGAGHSSTSISAGLGMAVGRDLLGENNSVISVIVDGAMTAGQAYEAMNNAGFLYANLIVILNDNKQVSLSTATMDGPATPVGALSSALSKI